MLKVERIPDPDRKNSSYSGINARFDDPIRHKPALGVCCSDQEAEQSRARLEEEGLLQSTLPANQESNHPTTEAEEEEEATAAAAA
jgi:hypothetical protein